MNRGSRKRLQRIKLRENTSVWFVIGAGVLLFLIFILLSWLMQHPATPHR
jgi:hypothetical protein